MPDFDHLMPQEPQSAIHITCQREAMPGQPEQRTLLPNVTITHMPGGWRTAFQVLLRAVQLVGAEMLKEERGQRLIEVAREVPDGSSVLRH